MPQPPLIAEVMQHTQHATVLVCTSDAVRGNTTAMAVHEERELPTLALALTHVFDKYCRGVSRYIFCGLCRDTTKTVPRVNRHTHSSSTARPCCDKRVLLRQRVVPVARLLCCDLREKWHHAFPSASPKNQGQRTPGDAMALVLEDTSHRTLVLLYLSLAVFHQAEGLFFSIHYRSQCQACRREQLATSKKRISTAVQTAQQVEAVLQSKVSRVGTKRKGSWPMYRWKYMLRPTGEPTPVCLRTRY